MTRAGECDSPDARGLPLIQPAVPGADLAQTALAPDLSYAAAAPGVPPLERRRLVTAFALTPLLAGFYPALFMAEPAVMPLGLLLAYVSTLLFGIPLVFYFDRRGVREWWMYLAGGAACVVPTIILYALAPLPTYLLPFGWIPVLGLLFWGASSGIVFWMIAISGESPVSLRTLFDPVSSRK